MTNTLLVNPPADQRYQPLADAISEQGIGYWLQARPTRPELSAHFNTRDPSAQGKDQLYGLIGTPRGWCAGKAVKALCE